MTPFTPAPSSEFQLEFLGKLQRLFNEGDFSATYKFALLLSLAELAVEKGTDNGVEIALTMRQIAERFVQLYWGHALPYGVGGPSTSPGVLIQNSGGQAAVVTAVAEFRRSAPSVSIQQARSTPGYKSLLSAVASIVSAQPIKYLQNFGGGTDAFLYERSARGAILLKPGVAYCLRRYFPLVQQLSRAHWIDHIKRNRRNRRILGTEDDLEDFLFSTSRQALNLIGSALRKLDGSRCFYCGKVLESADVDHFIPFSLYSRDLSHNFVLAHPTCNRSKSDTLAAKPHLERWLDRVSVLSSQLDEIGALAGVATDSDTAVRVAAWSYANAKTVGGRAWLSPAEYEPVNAPYLALFETRYSV